MEQRILYRVEELDELAVGVPIKRPIRDKTGKLMLRAGYVISDENELRLVRELMGGIIDEDNEILSMFKPVKIPPKDNPFDLFKLIQRRVKELLRGGADTVPDFQKNTITICEMIQEFCFEDEDIALGLAFMDRFSQYTIRHPIQTAIVCEVIGRGMNTTQDDRKQILAAALTMNISALALHERLQSQKEPLSRAQRLAIFDHPLADFRTLQRLGVADEVWLTSVLQHHEAIDGSGYPQGITGDAISVPAQLVSLSDIYTAMVSSRSYRLPMPANEAMKKIFLTGSHKVNESLAALFIKQLGIYPPGTVVRLQNGEIGVVTYRGKALNIPAVQSVIRANGVPYTFPQSRDTSAVEHKVIETLPQTQIDVGINNQQLWGHGDFSKKGAANRKETRAEISSPAELTIEGIPEPIPAAVLNISATGCLLQVPLQQKLREDTSYRLSFILFGRQLTGINFIMRNSSICDTKHLIGVKFIDLQEDYRTIIRLYLESVKIEG
ncbi:HD domain-containing phosphohydrolase [Candidatus Magnetominusculus xianensis]|uniref:Phosphohydrolase n=1 Tax=Candidatus Magnetominusculus xianensis TaxID=1748249 RepID=A0ABR5SEA9_9BACT|nr:HD domain-containing phosphohydrolase [Candidatus Magnetominusculus xianensis]KWT84127.1 phosphohydrolase [Candidatus Magnetominusculus xianensis]MBF0402421.1 PilZ domain-containing protein [Nitrospirota bacterium]